MMELLLLINGCIGAVAIICFFYLCYNVNFIKNKLVDKDYAYWERMYYKADIYGNSEEAKRALEEMIWIDVKLLNNNYTNSDRRKTDYTSLKNKYRAQIEKGQIAFPELDKISGIPIRL